MTRWTQEMHAELVSAVKAVQNNGGNLTDVFRDFAARHGLKPHSVEAHWRRTEGVSANTTLRDLHTYRRCAELKASGMPIEDIFDVVSGETSRSPAMVRHVYYRTLAQIRAGFVGADGRPIPGVTVLPGSAHSTPAASRQRRKRNGGPGQARSPGDKAQTGDSSLPPGNESDQPSSRQRADLPSALPWPDDVETLSRLAVIATERLAEAAKMESSRTADRIRKLQVENRALKHRSEAQRAAAERALAAHADAEAILEMWGNRDAADRALSSGAFLEQMRAAMARLKESLRDILGFI